VWARRLKLVRGLVGVVAAVLALPAVAHGELKCGQLMGLKIAEPRAVVTSATELSGYCKVQGVIGKIHFAMALPTQWNQKLLMLGGGGYDGVIPNTEGNIAAGPVPLARGYAVVGSDSGHQSSLPGLQAMMDATFALNAQALKDYAGEALKKTHDVAVYLIQARYGVNGPQRAYFAGGSTGGREALVAALRWPQDWDGAISLYPAWNAIALDLQVGRIARALAAPGGYLSQEKRELLYKASLRACDKLDGVEDGIVSNVAACNARFDPATTLRCHDGVGNNCLSDGELETLRVYSTAIVFQAPLASGEKDYPGYNIYGADLGRPGNSPMQSVVASLALGTDAPATSSLNQFWDHWTRYFVARDPGYNALSLDPQHLGSLLARVDELSRMLDVKQTDYSAFAAKGGKLLIAHGTADVLVSTRATEQYFERLKSAMGARKVRDFARFYEIPGYGHAASTVFNAAWDSLTTLENWVEKRVPPPDQVVTDTVGSPGRQRPLCEYPSWPKYRGKGDVNAASSFFCIREVVE
jgi:pimeloyl-ACP methyl ester carboxylesterase